MILINRFQAKISITAENNEPNVNIKGLALTFFIFIRIIYFILLLHKLRLLVLNSVPMKKYVEFVYKIMSKK